MVTQSARFNTDLIICEDLKQPEGPILTGLGYLDHMVDQFNSHAQIGVTLTIANFAEVVNEAAAESVASEDVMVRVHNRHADQDQSKLMRLVGSKIGAEFKRLMEEKGTTTSNVVGDASRFCCPLDEALVACQIYRKQTANDGDSGGVGLLESFTLPPYGKFPKTGRTRIGTMQTDKLRLFWESLAESSNLVIHLDKIRGDNGHHIVEAAFKAFARAFRNLLDGIDTTTMIIDDAKTTNNTTGNPQLLLEQLYGPDSDNGKQGVALLRQGSVKRQTKETSISATVKLDGGKAGVTVNTGIHTLNDFFTIMATSACISLDLTCQGDLWIDEHHTAEDVAIAMGQVLNQALGSKAGLNRMWCATAENDNAKVEVTMDLSNRPCLTHNLISLEDSAQGEMAGDLSLEMFEHVLDSLVVNAKMTVHIVELRAAASSSSSSSNTSADASSSTLNTVKAVATAFGRAFKYCSMVDSRRYGATASSKGTLSV